MQVVPAVYAEQFRRCREKSLFICTICGCKASAHENWRWQDRPAWVNDHLV